MRALLLIVLLSLPASAADRFPPLRQGCADRAEIDRRLLGYSKVETRTTAPGFLVEYWRGGDRVVEVTTLPNGDVCAFFQAKPSAAHAPAACHRSAVDYTLSLRNDCVPEGPWLPLSGTR
jgi:hypothetical protein